MPWIKPPRPSLPDRITRGRKLTRADLQEIQDGSSVHAEAVGDAVVAAAETAAAAAIDSTVGAQIDAAELAAAVDASNKAQAAQTAAISAAAADATAKANAARDAATAAAATDAQGRVDALGTTTLRKSQNLSDVADAGASRANLHSQVLASCRVVGTSNVALTGLQTIDGVALAAADRVLLAGQTDATQNGPWLVAAGAWTRPTDYAQGTTAFRSRQVLINEGTNAGALWQTLSSASRTVGTDPTTWTVAPIGLSQLPQSVKSSGRQAATRMPWPSGLLAFFPCTPGYVDADGSTLLSAEGVQQFAAQQVAGTTAFDAADPGPFGPSLLLSSSPASPRCWVIGGLATDGSHIGALDLSKHGDQFTLLSWVRVPDMADLPSGELHCRFGSHVEGNPRTARQYAQYHNTGSEYGGRMRYSPHFAAQDGPTPGAQFNVDFARSGRPTAGRWVLEVATFDGAQLTAYIDGLADTYDGLTDSLPTNPYTLRRVDYAANPYEPKFGAGGINPSTTPKVFSIGAALTGSTPYGVTNPSRGKLGGIAIFNRALTPTEIMRIRLATLLPNEPLATFDFVGIDAGSLAARRFGWRSVGGPYARELRDQTQTPAWRADGVTNGNGNLVRPTADNKPALAYFPTAGLRSTQVRRITFDMASALAAAPLRVAVKIGGQWYASNQTFACASDHSDFTTVEPQTFNVNLDVGQLRTLTLDDTGIGTTYAAQTFRNRIKQPSGEVSWSNYTPQAGTGGAVTTGDTTTNPFTGTKSYRITFTTPPTAFNASGADIVQDDDFTAGAVVSGSYMVRPSRETRMLLQATWRNSSNAATGTTLSGPVVLCPANVWTRLPVQGAADPTATRALLKIRASSSGTAWQAGDTLDIDGGILVEGWHLPDYFDGDTPGASWVGTAHQSASTRTIDVPGGVAIAVAGAANLARIPAGDLQAIGFLSQGTPGGIDRIRNIKLWRV